MKLKEVKDRIDYFFDNISADELINISVFKYGFTEITSNLEGLKFDTPKISYYNSSENIAIFNTITNKESYNLSLSA